MVPGQSLRQLLARRDTAAHARGQRGVDLLAGRQGDAFVDDLAHEPVGEDVLLGATRAMMPDRVARGQAPRRPPPVVVRRRRDDQRVEALAHQRRDLQQVARARVERATREAMMPRRVLGTFTCATSGW